MKKQKYTSSLSILVLTISAFLFFSCESNTQTSTEKTEIQQVPKKEQSPSTKIETAAFGAGNLTFAKNETCKECHPIIYDEFMKSSHSKSTVYNDAIHAAVWDLHPKNLKFQQYTCGKCHTPGADNAADFITAGKHGIPDSNNQSQAQGVSCAACHRIASMEQHEASNTILFSTENKTYFAQRPNPKKDSYHDIITTNASFNRGDACLACHSHNHNKSNLPICAMDIKVTDQKSGDNCMNCHMPQVEGSLSNERESGTHAFHGFPGTHNNQEMLAEHMSIQFGATKDKKGFVVIVQNRSPHDLFLQPLRVGKLKAKVIRNGKVIKEFKDQVFAKVLGADGKPTFPWKATEVIKNTILEKESAVTFNFEMALQKGDQVELTFGYHLVNPKAAPKLKLENNTDATKFRILKTSLFTI